MAFSRHEFFDSLDHGASSVHGLALALYAAKSLRSDFEFLVRRHDQEPNPIFVCVDGAQADGRAIPSRIDATSVRSSCLT